MKCAKTPLFYNFNNLGGDFVVSFHWRVICIASALQMICGCFRPDKINKYQELLCWINFVSHNYILLYKHYQFSVSETKAQWWPNNPNEYTKKKKKKTHTIRLTHSLHFQFCQQVPLTSIQAIWFVDFENETASSSRHTFMYWQWQQLKS